MCVCAVYVCACTSGCSCFHTATVVFIFHGVFIKATLCSRKEVWNSTFTGQLLAWKGCKEKPFLTYQEKDDTQVRTNSEEHTSGHRSHSLGH